MAQLETLYITWRRIPCTLTPKRNDAVTTIIEPCPVDSVSPSCRFSSWPHWRQAAASPAIPPHQHPLRRPRPYQVLLTRQSLQPRQVLHRYPAQRAYLASRPRQPLRPHQVPRPHLALRSCRAVHPRQPRRPLPCPYLHKRLRQAPRPPRNQQRRSTTAISTAVPPSCPWTIPPS